MREDVIITLNTQCTMPIKSTLTVGGVSLQYDCMRRVQSNGLSSRKGKSPHHDIAQFHSCLTSLAVRPRPAIFTLRAATPGYDATLLTTMTIGQTTRTKGTTSTDWNIHHVVYLSIAMGFEFGTNIGQMDQDRTKNVISMSSIIFNACLCEASYFFHHTVPSPGVRLHPEASFTKMV